jgi:ferritin-like metal-binding protein YciE
MMKDKYCKHCGGHYEIHQYKTLLCPVDGVEAADGFQQHWGDGVFELIEQTEMMQEKLIEIKALLLYINLLKKQLTIEIPKHLKEQEKKVERLVAVFEQLYGKEVLK